MRQELSAGSPRFRCTECDAWWNPSADEVASITRHCLEPSA